MNNHNFIGIKPHSRRKYSILRKYLGACSRFSDKYRNFAYVDTHGGTGEVIDLEKDKPTEGSVLTAAKLQPTFPCYVVEIDPDRHAVLKKVTSKLPNVTLYFGDCNEKINEILKMIPRGEKFVFCFLDPDGLVYGGIPQLKCTTIEKIAKFPRTEVLVNLPVFAIMRCAGCICDYGEAPSSRKMKDDIVALFGTDKWGEFDPGDYSKFLELFISERLKNYQFKGAILIRSVQTRGPIYYLVYGSNSQIGAKIMRDLMSNEWLNIIKAEPLTKIGKTKAEWLDFEYPLDKPFIFEY